MRSEAGVVAVAFGLALLAGAARADVYTWVDKEGTVHFQEEPPGDGVTARRLRSPSEEPPRAEPPPGETSPPPGGAAPPRGETALPRTAATPPGGPPPAAPAPARPAVKPRPAPVVDLFTTSWCPWCQKARDYFSSRGIHFTEHDIETDTAALRRKVGIDGDRRVPTAVIDGKVIRGFSPSAYQAALERR